MILLSLELSARRASIALHRDSSLLAERTWVDAHARNQELFAELPILLGAAEVDAKDVDVFVAGRGPGAYTGIRVALTTARMMALPRKREVFAISSGEALAYDVADEKSADCVAVIGDARRGHLWIGVFERYGDALEQCNPWGLITADQLARSVPAGATVVSPDWERLAGTPVSSLKGVIPEARFPRAARLGQIAFRRISKGAASEQFTPLYLHPPVG